MAKVALLIGVSDYQTGLQPLPTTKQDVEAVRRVLEHPDIGGFSPTDITTLLNPEPQQMREMLVTLFRNRQRSDLLLLYFSGHGMIDDQGTFYLTCARTNPELLEATAIPADFVHHLMENSRSKQQIVVLDCCFSAAFAAGMGVKGEAVNLGAQLGGQGRAVLTSSSPTEYSYEQKGNDLSVYTRYWVEGLQTGAADEDGNGWISVNELHDYARRKVRESAPAMQPRIYAIEEGYNIVLAKAPVGDPQLEYRREVERLAQERQGQFSQILLDALDEKCKKLNLSGDIAQAIQNEVLRPYQELKEKLRRYEQVVTSALQTGNKISQNTLDDLSYLQQALGLRDTDLAHINSRLPHHPHSAQTGQEIERFRINIHIGSKLINSKLLILLGSLIVAVVGGAFVVPYLLSSNREPSSPVNQPSPNSTPYKSAAEFFEQGLQKYNKGDYEGAIASYNESIRLGSEDVYIDYYNRGNAKSALGDNQGAIADYNEAIRLKPYFAVYYNNRGNAKSNLGDSQGAIKDFNQAIQINQNWLDIGLWTAYTNRGLAKSNLGDNQGAIADYNEAIRLKPDYAEAYNNRGIVKEELGDHKGAVVDYTKSIELNNPELYRPYNNRGNSKSALGDYKEAVVDYTKSIELNNPELHIPYRNRGNAKRALGDYEGAVADYTKAIRSKPDYADAYYKRGLAKSNLSDKQGAIADYREAAKLFQQRGEMGSYREVMQQLEQLQ